MIGMNLSVPVSVLGNFGLMVAERFVCTELDVQTWHRDTNSYTILIGNIIEARAERDIDNFIISGNASVEHRHEVSSL